MTVYVSYALAPKISAELDAHRMETGKIAVATPSTGRRAKQRENFTIAEDAARSQHGVRRRIRRAQAKSADHRTAPPAVVPLVAASRARRLETHRAWRGAS